MVSSFNLVIERLLISGYGILTFVSSFYSFNLVIERLLISGIAEAMGVDTLISVSISLSSGFSFQVAKFRAFGCTPIPVSISLSSGFSFQDT